MEILEAYALIYQSIEVETSNVDVILLFETDHLLVQADGLLIVPESSL